MQVYELMNGQIRKEKQNLAGWKWEGQRPRVSEEENFGYVSPWKACLRDCQLISNQRGSAAQWMAHLGAQACLPHEVIRGLMCCLRSCGLFMKNGVFEAWLGLGTEPSRLQERGLFFTKSLLSSKASVLLQAWAWNAEA